ncbi:MAG TPA: hypothetical protein VGR71_07445 [Nitrospira sp.]|nr:hypothetical protein [Nitrospira sp.]
MTGTPGGIPDRYRCPCLYRGFARMFKGFVGVLRELTGSPCPNLLLDLHLPAITPAGWGCADPHTQGLGGFQRMVRRAEGPGKADLLREVFVL